MLIKFISYYGNQYTLNIAIIPARKGSKRIKKKNIVFFKNKPMICWTINAAKKSRLFDKIYVDTDCKKTKSISIKNGAEVPFLRDKKFAKDNISVNQSTYNFLLRLKKKENLEIKNVFQLMANCPFRDSNDIIKSYKKFLLKKCRSLISHVRPKFFNPWWSAIEKNGKILRLFKSTYKKRSQDLPELMCPTGAIWIADYKAFMKHKSFYIKNYSYEILEWKNGIDIDTYDELIIGKTLK